MVEPISIDEVHDDESSALVVWPPVERVHAHDVRVPQALQRGDLAIAPFLDPLSFCGRIRGQRLVRELPPRTLLLLTYRSDHDARSLTTPDTIEVRLDGLAPSASRRLISELLGDDRSLDCRITTSPRLDRDGHFFRSFDFAAPVIE